MPLDLTSTGKVQHRDFSHNQSCPAWLTESVAGTGAISYGATGATLNADGDASGAILVSTANVNGLTHVRRVKAQKSNSTNSRAVISNGIWDSVAQPAVTALDLSWDEPFVCITRSAGAVETIYCRDDSGDTTLLNPATTQTFYIHDIYVTGGNHFVRLRSAADFSVLGSDTGAVAHATDAWFWCGDPKSTAGSSYRGPLLVEYIQWFESYDITVTGVPAGSAGRLIDASGTVIDSSVAVGTTITLDGATCDFNSCPDKATGGFRGTIVIYEDDSYAKPLTTYRSNSIWGGDEYAYTEGSNKTRRPHAIGARR